MKTKLLALAAAATLAVSAVALPRAAEARGGGIAAGVAAGLIGGAIIGGALAGPGYYGYGPGYYYGPGYGYYGGPGHVRGGYRVVRRAGVLGGCGRAGWRGGGLRRGFVLFPFKRGSGGTN